MIFGDRIPKPIRIMFNIPIFYNIFLLTTHIIRHHRKKSGNEIPRFSFSEEMKFLILPIYVVLRVELEHREMTKLL